MDVWHMSLPTIKLNISVIYILKCVFRRTGTFGNILFFPGDFCRLELSKFKKHLHKKSGTRVQQKKHHPSAINDEQQKIVIKNLNLFRVNHLPKQINKKLLTMLSVQFSSLPTNTHSSQRKKEEYYQFCL